jgi:hypothetical protein
MLKPGMTVAAPTRVGMMVSVNGSLRSRGSVAAEVLDEPTTGMPEGGAYSPKPLACSLNVGMDGEAAFSVSENWPGPNLSDIQPAWGVVMSATCVPGAVMPTGAPV